MALLIPFACRRADDRYVDALAVSKGKDCDCYCPACGKGVLARHCTEITSHFAHLSTAECAGAYETSLHEAAKQVIVELGFVWLPASALAKSRRFVFARAEIERGLTSIRPDVTVYTAGGRPLALEVLVTHAIDEVKLARLRTDKLACIEFDLSAVPRDLSYSVLCELFESDKVVARWAHNPKAEAVERERARQEQLRAEHARLQREREQRAQQQQQERDFAEWLASPHAKPRELRILGEAPHDSVAPCPVRRRGWNERFRGVAFGSLDCPTCPYCAGRFPTVSGTEIMKCIGHFPKLALADAEIVRRFGGNLDRGKDQSSGFPADDGFDEPNPF